MSALSPRENKILAGLHPHTRRHAIALLARYPSLHVSSGKRTARRNKEVGGAIRSFHLSGRAVDFIGTREDLSFAYRMALRMRVGVGCTGPEEAFLEDLGEPNQHLHVAW